MRLFMFVLLSLLALQQYHLWFGKNGLQDNSALKKEVALVIVSNADLRQRNQMMFAEIDNLKRGSQAIEERARNELGLVKEGETFFHIVPKED
ncbi:cell division protein FtsB [Psychromonas antarctica]|uniref:cell division protein FtsB n=1 Tax=Psychromonas antarctica TaxID=67573 RepID=UPI001EE79543|nr:cell division protein FtsB [Psychromonas antarctica]MCG6200393.1 cell division protein FtsB [Psychromonas antarctica]